MPDLAAFDSAWIWLVVGLALVAAETVVPGIFLVWFGLAALLTGALDFALDLSWQTGLIAFAALSVLTVLGGRALTRRPGEASGAQPLLNRRGEALVGRVLPLDGALRGGEGRVRVDDSVWRVIGPDLAAGAPVRVVRIDGATLVVEPA